MEYFDLEDPFTSLKQHQCDKISTLFSSESDHMPSQNCFQCLKTSDFYVSFRQEAISLILQVSHIYINLLLFFFFHFLCYLLFLPFIFLYLVVNLVQLISHSIFITFIPTQHTQLLTTWIGSSPNKKSRYVVKLNIVSLSLQSVNFL